MRYLRWGRDGEAVQPEKWQGVWNCLGCAQNPQRQVHALLEGFVQDSLIENQSHRLKTDKIIARTLFFSKNQKLQAKTFTEKICQRLEVKIYQNFCRRNQADFENLI